MLENIWPRTSSDAGGRRWESRFTPEGDIANWREREERILALRKRFSLQGSVVVRRSTTLFVHSHYEGFFCQFSHLSVIFGPVRRLAEQSLAMKRVLLSTEPKTEY